MVGREDRGTFSELRGWHRFAAERLTHFKKQTFQTTFPLGTKRKKPPPPPPHKPARFTLRKTGARRSTKAPAEVQTAAGAKMHAALYGAGLRVVVLKFV
ncbi:hypothetical protein L596_005785 [Steinernema carpocapsae]|uniref:Uncharacterized protein n=1 Tax=Steinernema carpocapsae TaxID=34508 RepID=A0A4U8V1K0_STECR|nr:hypothetical protein L596_005785 [Steinernema carpocapsae]